MYEVMARRYRPALFDEVVGQEHIALTLKNAIVRDRVAHAFIFTGGHGCGKTTMARILAKALVCVKGPAPDPCRVCPVCVDVAAGRDSDVLEIDGASNNGIEQIRQLREQAVYVPTRARYKIYIIDEVHMLSDGAFNALLKTLEEPPRHVKFILATTDPHKVPDTILSRCQRFDFRLVPQDRLSVFFRRLAAEEKAEIDDEALEAVAAFAEGSVRDGLVLLDQLLSFADGRVTRRDVEAVRGVASAENVAGVYAAIRDRDVAAALAVVDEVASRGANAGDFLDQLIAFGRDLMLLAATGSREGIAAYGPARETVLRLGETTSLETALLYLDVFAQARTRVRSRALSNPLVALEMAVARLSGLGGVTPLSEILAKLGEASVPAPAPVPSAAPPLPAASLPEAPRRQPSPPLPPPPVSPASLAPPPSPLPPPSPVESVGGPAAGVSAFAAPYSGSGADGPPGGMADGASGGEPPALDMTSVSAGWDKVLDALSEKNAADVRHMSRVSPVAASGGTVRLSGPSTAVEAMRDGRRLARLSEAAAGVFGRPVEFEFLAAPPRRAGGDAADGDDAPRRLARHPGVAKVKDLFDGVVVDCRLAAPAPRDDPAESAPADAGPGEMEEEGA